MKRFALLVGALAVSASAHAQDAAEFKNSGEFRVRYDNYLNKTATDNSQGEAETTARLKWNLGVRKGENIQVFASLIHNSTFGTGDSRNPSGGGTTNADLNSVGDENALVVSRAWGWWKASDMVALKVGRFGIEIADGAVFAEDDYFAFPNTHEGLNAAFDTGFAAINLYAVKVAELAQGANNSDPETNRYILSFDLKNMPEAIKMANVHVVQTNKDSTDDAAAAGSELGAANWQHIGLTVGGDAMNILYKGTAAFQMGTFSKTTAQDTKLSANMFDLMVGYQMPETMNMKFTLNYHQDSGDSSADDKVETYQKLSYDSHNYAGLMDVVDWGNLTYIALGFGMMPAEDIEVGLGYYMFTATKDAASDYGPAWNGAVSEKLDDKNIGSELDVYANKSYANDIKVGARFGMFMPGARLKDAAVKQDKNMMEAMLQASIGF